MTFAELDRAKGYPELGAPQGEEFPLPAWYRQVYRVPLEMLSVLDVCRACQQQIHLEHIVPVAFRLLAVDLLAGERYEGELISALINLPANYWKTHASDVPTLIRRCAIILSDHIDEIGPELAREIDRFLQEHNQTR